ncbi:MAG: phosphatidylglycerol lysyltransferase [Myxococcota bacterium]|jgi:phosphatidylglycerol lysyltransferase
MADVEQDSERDRVLEILKAHGSHATSFQLLESGYQYWFDPVVGQDGRAAGAVIAWVRAGRWRVAAGVPIAAGSDVGDVAGRFIQEARGQGDRVLFFSADQAFMTALDGVVAFDSVAIGEQPEWDPRNYSLDAKERRGLRAQVSRARNKGVTVRTVDPAELSNNPGFRAEIESVLHQWRDARRMSAMRFLVDLEPFHYASERRYYVAEHAGRAVGFLAVIPVYSRQGWFFEDMIRVPDAPNGTIEILVDAAMQAAHEHGDAYVTLGLAPLAGIPAGAGPHRLVRGTLRWCAHNLGALYGFESLRRFKQRFRPDVWRPQYLVQSPPGIGVGSFHAVLKAFAGGGLVAFGADTVRRQAARVGGRAWAAAVWVIAALLVPWTVLLAAADGAHWFGDPSIQTGWVVFDALMVGALTGLGRLLWRGSARGRPVAMLLAGATLTDFVLTTAQAFYLHSDVAGGALLFLLAGVAGPLSATALLVLIAAADPRVERR